MTGGVRAETVLVTGALGMLGSALTAVLGSRAVALGHDRLDVCDRAGVSAVLHETRPGLVINCAAATDVDRCESDRAYAHAANADGPSVIAGICAHEGIGLVHVSTDYVFDGTKGAPYAENDPPNPLSYYGLTKLWGEEAVLAESARLPVALVARTSWVFGRGGPRATNFPLKVLGWAERTKEIRVIADQWGSPTYAPFLAEAILALVDAGARGVYHLAGAGCASRFELAVEVVSEAGLDLEVEPATSAEFPTPASRPERSCLDCSRAAGLGVALPPWPEGVRRYLVEILRREPIASCVSGAEDAGSIPERQVDP